MQSVYLDDRITFVCSCLLRGNTVSGHFQGKPFVEIVIDENSWIKVLNTRNPCFYDITGQVQRLCFYRGAFLDFLNYRYFPFAPLFTVCDCKQELGDSRNELIYTVSIMHLPHLEKLFSGIPCVHNFLEAMKEN